MRLNPYNTMTPQNGNWKVDGAREKEEYCSRCGFSTNDYDTDDDGKILCRECVDELINDR